MLLCSVFTDLVTHDEGLASVQSLHETMIITEKLYAEEKNMFSDDLKGSMTEHVVQKAVSACDVGTMTRKLVEQLCN